MSYFYAKSGIPLQAETETWKAGVIAGSGTFESDSIAIADALVVALKAEAYYSKIIYLLPFLGSNMNAAKMPLIDTLAKGIAGNTGFVDADFSQATGLQLAPTKFLASGHIVSDLNASALGGLGTWELNATRTHASNTINNHIVGAAYQAAGSVVAQFSLQLYPTIDVIYRGLNASSEWALGGPSIGGFHYGQRSSSTLVRLFRNSGVVASNTNAYVGSANLETQAFTIGRMNNGVTDPNLKANGRIGLILMTDGTLSDANVSALYTLLGTYLITPTGR